MSHADHSNTRPSEACCRTRHIFGSALPALSAAFAGFPVYMYAPELFVSEYGLSLAAVGIILPLLRIIDAVADPIIGSLSDYFSHYRRLIGVGALCLTAIGTLLLFSPIDINPALRFTFGVLLATGGYSITIVQLQMCAASINQPRSRSTMITIREALGLTGLLAAVILPYVLEPYIGKVHAFFATAIICVALTVIIIPFFMRAVNALPQNTADTHHRYTLKQIWPEIRRMPVQLRGFFLAYGLFSLAAALPAALAVFFISDRLGTPSKTGIFLLLYFVAALAALPLWQRLAGRFGIRRIWAAACMVAVCGFIGAFFLGQGDIEAFAVICILSGSAFGAGLTLPSALLAQLVRDEALTAMSGLLFSLLTLLQKSGLAAAAGLALPLLALIGYEPNSDTHSHHALYALSFIYAVVPCIIQSTVAYLLLRSRNIYGDIIYETSSFPTNSYVGHSDA